MSLVRLSSDQGDGQLDASVFVESTEVALITPAFDSARFQSENKTMITLRSGEKIAVKDWPADVAKKLTPS